jgi:hypothetical protein
VDLRLLELRPPDETGTVRVVLGFTEPGDDHFDNGGTTQYSLLTNV